MRSRRRCLFSVCWRGWRSSISPGSILFGRRIRGNIAIVFSTSVWTSKEKWNRSDECSRNKHSNCQSYNFSRGNMPSNGCCNTCLCDSGGGVEHGYRSNCCDGRHNGTVDRSYVRCADGGYITYEDSSRFVDCLVRFGDNYCWAGG